ncbi:MAG: Asp23/Gls24 family envelope stress response protein [Firmicutes bacterium]|nr:Asp23/Gls24 family envelope stress response protein [Bacillota bacterium]
MIRRETELGSIAVSNSVYTKIAGNAATNCFGVKGMAIRSVSDGLVHLLRRESMAKGVLVTPNDDGTISIDLHIMIDQGVNIPALGQSIVSEVRYMVSQQTDTEVKAVNVIIDSMMLD